MRQFRSAVIKLIGYARVSNRQQATGGSQQAEILAAGVRRDDLYVDGGSSGARAARPQLALALAALETGDTFVITALDRLGQSTQNVLALAEDFNGRGVGLRVLNLGDVDGDTATATGSMLFTVMAALGQMEHESSGSACSTVSTSVGRQARISAVGRGSSLTERSATLIGSSKVERQQHRSRAISECLAPPSTAGLAT
jgi:hypothetical protein